MWLLIFFILITIFIIRKILECLSISKIKGKAVVITGCDTGFGHEAAIKCAKNGMIVFAGCLLIDSFKELENKCRKFDGEIFCFLINVADDESVKKGSEIVRNIMHDKEIDGLHGLIVNAGILGDCGPFDWMSTKEYKRVFEINTFGGMRTIEYFKEDIKKGKGRIIITASICGRIAIPNIGPYTCSKYAMEAFADVLRNEMRPFGVKVICLEPGFFKTPLIKEDAVVNMLDCVYKKCDDSIKNQYGIEYFNYIVKTTKGHLYNRSSSNYKLVSDAYYHSLISYWPYPRYQIGFDSRFIYIPISYSPTEIFDMFVALYMIVTRAPKPKGFDND
uniref:Estradiol 17-beta-dehydrogenase 2 n=1 Tax=Parastrongyloides trichosuri TaxID=131310 RepID=A0A0N4Z0S6_PARTI